MYSILFYSCLLRHPIVTRISSNILITFLQFPLFVIVSDAHAFNGDISGWNVSQVTSLLNTFGGAHSFNGDVSSWDVSNVEELSWTFHDAKSFNGDLSNWNTSSATEMIFLFYGAQ